jgi:hypothetical protein
MDSETIEKNTDPNNEFISNIENGWVLKDGSIYLFVKCADGVVRSTVIKCKAER